MLNGEDVTANTFKIQQYGVLAAIFDIDNGISECTNRSCESGETQWKYSYNGIATRNRLPDLRCFGKMLYTGMTDANGNAEISLSTGHLIIIKQNDTVIKIRC